MNTRLVMLIPKGKMEDNLGKFMFFGESDLSQKEFEKLDIAYSFNESYFFEKDDSQCEIINEINERKEDGELFFNKQLFDPLNLKVDWNNAHFITYNENKEIINIEMLEYENKKGIMDGFSNERNEIGIFKFNNKKLGLNLHYFLKEGKDFDYDHICEKYDLYRCIDTNDLMFSENEEDREIWDAIYNKENQIVYLKYETKKIMLKEFINEINQFSEDIFKKTYKNKYYFISKYGKEKHHEYYINQPLIKEAIKLFKDKKISMNLYLNIEELYFLGKQKYINIIKYRFINTKIYIYNNKVKKIKSNYSIEKEPKKHYLDLYRQYRNYYRRTRSAIKNRNFPYSILIHY